jgi:hypothetical protein
MAGAVLVLSSSLNLSCAAAQDSSAAPTQVSAAAQAQGRAHIDAVLKGLNRGRSVGQVAVSPDGKRLAWLQNGRDGAEIRVAPLTTWQKAIE